MRPAQRAAVLWLGLLPALVLLVVPRIVDLPQDPSAGGLGAAVTTELFTAFGAISLAGAVVAVRSGRVAVGVHALATLAVALLVWIEFRPVVFVLAVVAALPVAAAFAAGPLVFLRRAGPFLLVAVVIAAIGGLYGRAYYLDVYGETHPDSSRSAPGWLADWMWVGGVGPDRATITAGGLGPGAHRLLYWSDPTSLGSVAATPDVEGVARFELTGLEPDTEYEYRIVASSSDDGALSTSESSFATPAVGAQDLTVVLGVCARTGSNGAVFDAIVAEDPDLYVMLGDLHYANLGSGDPSDHLEALGRSLRTPAQSTLFSSVPTAYVWDDHDYGDNDSDSTSPSRSAVASAYRRAVPHYGVDPDPDAPISQAFSVGRVRFVMTDTRSQRTEDTMLGPAQERWLVDEIVEAAATHALVVWASPAPWIGPDEPGSDPWAGYPEERERIADAIAAVGITNLVMLGGDHHMVALDDGTNSGYSSDGRGGFPVLHGGPLDRPASVGVGTFSHGTFADDGQYGRMVVDDDGGDTIGVRLSGHTWDGTELTALELEFDVPDGA